MSVCMYMKIDFLNIKQILKKTMSVCLSIYSSKMEQIGEKQPVSQSVSQSNVKIAVLYGDNKRFIEANLQY